MLPRLTALTLIAVVGISMAMVGTSGAQETGSSTSTAIPTTTEELPTVEPLPPADMPLALFAERRRAIRSTAHEAKTNRCRSHQRVHFVYKSWQISPTRRAENLAYWRERRERIRAQVSKCYPAVMRRKFNAMPSYRVQQWMNIHSCEGSWTDPNDPYWGGLQMGWWFMRNYGSDALRYYGGPANRWPWYVQIVVADRAVSDSGVGFSQWPTCAARFGYI